jgi:AraC-like DNA-binding protein
VRAMIATPPRTGDLAELRAHVLRGAPGDGRHPSPLAEVAFARAGGPRPLAPSSVPSLVLAVVVQGKKVSRFEGRELHYDAETYLVVPGECAYESAIVGASAARPYLSLMVQLPPELVVDTLLSLGADAAPVASAAAAPVAGGYVSRLDPTMIETLCRLLRTVDDPGERRVVAPLVLGELVFRLLRSDWAAALRRLVAHDGDHARVQRAMAFMRANLGRRLTVAAVAREVAMSPSHFAHRFREVARLSPMTYLKHLRLHAARALLLQEGLRPGEVAARVGYGSATHFHRDFKGRFELPPAAYCKQFRESQDPITRSQAASSR